MSDEQMINLLRIGIGSAYAEGELESLQEQLDAQERQRRFCHGYGNSGPPEDLGGNFTPDRIEANQDIYPCENGHDIGFNGFCHRCGEEQPAEEES